VSRRQPEPPRGSDRPLDELLAAALHPAIDSVTIRERVKLQFELARAQGEVYTPQGNAVSVVAPEDA